jgi:acyl carrier protein
MSEADVIKWLEGVFNEEPGVIAVDTPRDALPEWDSLGVLNLMADMDAKFGILLSNDDLEAMNEIGDIIKILKDHEKLTVS